ncbi:ammonium transporter [Leptodesmis sichuanensis]|uniref:ammonium transporter n=1 Tax=Leptodesmis sichuanensis TaxID=2906798 RepID=UPI001F318C1F|nr:ammonium transporter [Leptodesmis sichuanensis]UIE36629.1 ammonium transporter [Leptodesmis sichuanensis A121]
MVDVASAQTPAGGKSPYDAIDTGDTAWMLISTALVLFMTPGLAFFYGGLVRSRNVLNMMMMSCVSMAIVGVTWILWGYSLSFSHIALNEKNWDTGIGSFIGSLSWIGLKGVGYTPDPIYATSIPHQLFMAYQMMFAIITVALVSGAIAERMSFKAYVWFLLLWSTFIYCPMAHMVWGRGWLGYIGALDFAGGTVVHISSGVSAFVAAWMLGPRKDFTVKPIVPHNVPYVLLGVGMLWFGWFGFNGGSAIGIGRDPSAVPLATVAFVATTVSTSAAGLAWMLVEWFTKGKPTAVGIGSGFVAGLVGITPAAGFVTPLAAIVIGIVTSLCCFAAVNIKATLQFDDSLDTFPIHGVGGTVGAILTGIFATKVVNGLGADGLLSGNPVQVLIQIVAVLIAYVIAAVGTFVILKLVGLFTDLRVKPQFEEEGLDIHEHGEEAYGESLTGEITFATKLSE